MSVTVQPVDTFEANRQFLLGLAYRLLGRYTEAEDMVQETYLRWHQVVQTNGAVQNPRSFLSRILTNLCLDYMKSARVKREEYIGPWLPEPVLERQVQPVMRDDEVIHFDDMPDLSYALMLSLERLSPLERAVFILHDVFSVPFVELSETLQRTEAACRQLASRARKNIRQEKKRFAPSRENLAQLLNAFLDAASSQNIQTLNKLLAEDAVLYSDGGGLVMTAARPLEGGDCIARFFCALYENKPELKELEKIFVLLNGEPAVFSCDAEGLIQAGLLSLDENGLIDRLYFIRNPQKLCHLATPHADAETT